MHRSIAVIKGQYINNDDPICVVQIHAAKTWHTHAPNIHLAARSVVSISTWVRVCASIGRRLYDYTVNLVLFVFVDVDWVTHQ
jgi:phosphoglucomutase